jgi:3-deoxy-D-manno-octulosonate 8-phosphate phosphatase (KDO 8-P phosphatase)
MIDPHVASTIQLVAFDVDGVLTDGGIYLGDVGGMRGEFKRYDIQDGLGILFLRMAGIRVVIITGRVSDSVRLRADELDVDYLVQDPGVKKLAAFRRMASKFGVEIGQCAFVGDDFPDLAALRVAGLSVAVANAAPEVAAACDLKLSRTGGHGAAREFAELLLKARGEWEAVTSRYVAERATDAAVKA